MFRYPSRVLFLDDNEQMLRSLSSFFGTKGLDGLYTARIDEALALVNQNRHAIETLLPYQDDEAYLARLYRVLQDPRRFDVIRVIVSDYDMPVQNGLSVLAREELQHVSKVLLTGVADERMAVKAFNDGVINAFMKKTEQDLLASLLELVHKYQQPRVNTYVQTPFDRVADDLFRRHNMIECYPMDRAGSHVMLNDAGQLLYLQIHTAEELEDMWSFANDFGTDGKTLSRLAKKEFAFSYLALDPEEAIPEPPEWVTRDCAHIYPLQRHSDNLYYTVSSYEPRPDVVARAQRSSAA